MDLDLDGHPEVVAGNTAYRGSGPQQGQILWQTTSAPGGPVKDGYTAVANFDADPNPEIVLVTHGVVWMLEHDGAVKWGPVAIPGNAFYGSSPAIGNLDGDPELEFVVGGQERLVAFEGDGTVAWAASFPTLNREAASAALFDFDGDGAAEVVYRDEHSLRIFGGGQVLFEARTWGNAARSSPVIADADGDGKPEIVLHRQWRALGAAGRRRPPRLRRLRGHLAPVAAALEPVRVPRLERERRRLDPGHRDPVAAQLTPERVRARRRRHGHARLRVREAGSHRVVPAGHT